MILDANGRFVSGVNANELLDTTNSFTSMIEGMVYDDPLTNAYVKFLEGGIVKAAKLKKSEEL